MKAVVTGGAGFIGSHLCELLKRENIDVVVIDNLSTGRIENITHLGDAVKFIHADLCIVNDEWAKEVRDCDYIFHLASLADIVPSIEDPKSYYHNNVTSTLNLLLNSDANKLNKFVYAASSSCYGIADTHPTPETYPIRPEYPYALTKRMGEELVLHWHKVYGLKVISTRFFNVFGTRSRTSGTYGAVFGVFLAQKLAGRPLTVVGDGNQSRDFTYVTDICEGMLLAARSKYECEVFNLASGKPQTVNYLASLISSEVVNIPKRPGEPDITHADISKAVRQLGYQPKVSFEEGVSRVIDSIDYWQEAPVWTPESIAKATRMWFNCLTT
jgi:UDP-glucose 4-epimerase